MKRRAEPGRKTRRGWPHRQTLLASVLVNVFDELRVSAAVHVDATAELNSEWYPIAVSNDIVDFEVAHGVEQKRWRYNERSFARARRERKLIVGQHAGFHDLFVPLGSVDDSWGTLAVGPFLVEPPSSGEILTRWRQLTGALGRLGEPAFARYVSTTLETLTLDGALLRDFEKFVRSFGALCAEGVDLERATADLDPIRFRLRDARFAEYMWQNARSLTDEHMASVWNSPDASKQLLRLGLKKLPEHVAIGLMLGARTGKDPLDDLVRREAFQRACVDYARKRGGLVSGRIERHGVLLILEDSATGAALRSRISEVTARIAALARRHGLELHVGTATRDVGESLAKRYQAALSAAERALSEGQSEAQAARDPQAAQRPLRNLRKQLGETLRESPNLLSPRFQRYFEAVAAHAGYRLEAIRIHLEVGFDQIAEALEASAVLDQRSFSELCASAERDAAKANTVSELSRVYQRLIADIELALTRPKHAGQERGLRRAVAFIQDHLGESLELERVARAGGFGARNFSRVFSESEGATFQEYTRNLRIERTKSMLLSTTLSVERIAQLCGFVSRVHFHRAFKRASGMTPVEYRARGGALT